jgi:hypothetical protein
MCKKNVQKSNFIPLRCCGYNNKLNE